MSYCDVSGEVTRCWPQLPRWEISVCRCMSSFSLRKLQGKHDLQRTARFQPRQELGEYLEKRIKR